MRPLALKNVLVASDLSDAMIPALRTAANLAQLTGANLHVVHANESPPPQSSLERQVRAAGINGVPGLSTLTLQGLPGATIAQEAWRIGANVVVMGPHRRERSGLGSTADRVVRAVSAPLLIIPEELKLPLERVVVPVDVAAGARGLLEVALSWTSALRPRPAEKRSCTLTALHVSRTDGDPTQDRAALDREITLVRERLADLARVKVEHHLVQGSSVSDAILQFAESMDANLLILGTRGKHEEHGELLGSVSSAVVNRAALPMLLVPPARWRDEVDPLP